MTYLGRRKLEVWLWNHEINNSLHQPLRSEAPGADAKAACLAVCAPALTPGRDPAAPTQPPWGPSGGCQQDAR